jgi:putative spermidine/putrescine transport system permease protein
MGASVVQKKLNLSGILFFAAIVVYLINISGILLTVILNSFSRNWFSGIIPKIFTTEWYRYLATDHDIFNLLGVTFLVAISVVVISLLIA